MKVKKPEREVKPIVANPNRYWRQRIEMRPRYLLNATKPKQQTHIVMDPNNKNTKGNPRTRQKEYLLTVNLKLIDQISTWEMELSLNANYVRHVYKIRLPAKHSWFLVLFDPSLLLLLPISWLFSKKGLP